MTRQTLANAITNAPAVPEEPKSIAHMLVDPKIKQQIAMALPRHMTADRLARIVLTEVRKVPKLAQCDQMSFMGAVMQAAQLGLEPGSALGHCYLIPFDKRGKLGNGQWGVIGTEVQLIIGYRGMLDLARRSGQILSLEARPIYENDNYAIAFGLDSVLSHQPLWSGDRGKPLFFYAVAKLKDGGTQFEVMSVDEINAIRDASQGYKAAVANAAKYKKDTVDSPWATHYEEMAKKTVLRRLFKYLPVSIEMQQAVGLDELADAGVRQQNALVIDSTYRIEDAHTTNDSDAQGVTDELNKVIHDAMVIAASMDDLNSAWELGGPEWNPPDALRTLYNTRAEEMKA